MKQKIIVELNSKIALELKKFHKEADLDHPAFNNFSVQVPCTVIYDIEDLVVSLAKANNMELEVARKLVNSKLKEWKLDIDVKFSKDSYKYTVRDLYLDVKILEAVVPKLIGFFPVIKFTTFEEHRGLLVATYFINIINGVLANLDSSNYSVVESRQQIKNSNKKKNKKKNKKTNVKYLVTKKYIVKELSKDTDKIANLVEREYVKDSWQVKGFWATTRNGKKYWRKPSVRHRRKTINSNKEDSSQPMQIKMNNLAEDLK